MYMEPPKFIVESLELLIQQENRINPIQKKVVNMLESLESGDKVFELKKSIYGLRQAGRNWHSTLDKVLRKFGAIPTKSDPCVYRIGQKEDIILIAVYVDDMIFASENIKKIEELKKNIVHLVFHLNTCVSYLAFKFVDFRQ